MLTGEQLKVLSNFLLDGAKIIFGSLVVGAFVSTAAARIPWVTVLVGLSATSIFLVVAMNLAKEVKETP